MRRNNLDEYLIGKRFGRLIVLERIPKTRKYRCRCDCGNECEAYSYHLERGAKKSCGCYKKERSPYCHRTHGGRYDRLYAIWVSMRDRCGNGNNKDYGRYGGRGIRVCEEWEDYAQFKKWALSVGYDNDHEEKEMTLDRIDNDGDYRPENCRFTSRAEQMRNTSKTIMLEHNGIRKPMCEWADDAGIDRATMRYRILHGWGTEAALTVRPGCWRKELVDALRKQTHS